MENTIIRIESVSKNFGGMKALINVNMKIPRGEIISLIGPNGAGKTTLLNAITRQFPLSGGRIYFEDERIDLIAPYKIAELGIGRTFQIVNLPQRLTVLENVAIGAYSKSNSSMLQVIFRSPAMKAEEQRITDKAMDIIKSFNLEDYTNDTTGHLPLGSQRIVEMARAMMIEPKIIFLDEVTTGLNLEERKRVIDVIKKIHGQGMTVFIIAHDMAFVTELSHKIFVLYFGKNLAEGTPEEVQENQEVINVYLGKTNSNS